MLLFLLLATLSSDPAVFVRSLYEGDQRGAPDPVYGIHSRRELLKTFEGPIVDLIWTDLVDAQGEVGRMDAHWLTGAQDNELENLQIRTVENANGRARVVATWDWPQQKGRAEFLVRNTKDGWRISNIKYPNGDYMTDLEADFPLPKIEDERAEKALCELYEDYDANLPEDYDLENDSYAARELAEELVNAEKPDYGAALHVLCGDEFMADAEKWGMLEHVLHMERGATDEPLDFCHFSTSRDGGIFCASRREDREGPQLEARYEAIHKKSGKAIEPLRRRADAFIQADAFWEAEQSKGGTMYVYAETHATLDRRKRFIELLEQFSQKRAPTATESDWKRADAALNDAYQKRVARIEPCDPEFESCEGPTEKDNLREAQRAWIPYRDAWIAYYQERWRGAASPEALRREIAVAISKARIEELGNT